MLLQKLQSKYTENKDPLFPNQGGIQLCSAVPFSSLCFPKVLRSKYSKSVGSKILNSVILFVLVEPFFLEPLTYFTREDTE